MIKQDRVNQIFISNGNHSPSDFKGNMCNNKGGDNKYRYNTIILK